MSEATTAMVVLAERAEQIDNIFEGLVRVGCQLVWAADGARDGIALRHVLKTDSLEAQQFCLAAGVLVAEGWLSMVVVQGRVKGFIRTYPKIAASPPKQNLLQFPMRNCGSKSGQVTSGAVVPLRRP